MKRTLPNFLVIGGVRCATTSLYHYLGSHPEVFMAGVKEPRFFVYQGGKTRKWDTRTAKTLDEYSSLFAGSQEAARGEASAIYLYQSELAVPRIRETIPEAKFIAIIRNPAERAFSQYRMAVAVGAEKLPTFRSALDAEDRRVERGGHPIFHYQRQSLYAAGLERFLETFGEGQLAVFTFEDLTCETPRTMAKVYDFLGVDPRHIPDTRRAYFSTRVRKSALLTRTLRRFGMSSGKNIVRQRLDRVEQVLGAADRAYLAAYYRDDVRRTEMLTGRNLKAWLDE